jgi:hypothetical protein
MAGADRGALVAYLTSWSLLGFQRVMVWELPLMGVDFALLRSLANLPLPIIAGLLARWLPGIEPRLPQGAAPGAPASNEAATPAGEIKTDGHAALAAAVNAATEMGDGR